MQAFLKYNYMAYKDTLTLQIYLADNNIDMTYTDSISISELEFLFNTMVEFIKAKNDRNALK